MTHSNAVTIGIALAVAVAFLFVGVGAVAAGDNAEGTVGTSGHCSQGDNGGGGSGSVTVDGDPGEEDVDAVEGPGEAQSIVEGLAFFFQQKQAHPQRDDTCDGGNGDDSYDYLETHAGPVQACYSEDNADNQGDISANGNNACH